MRRLLITVSLTATVVFSVGSADAMPTKQRKLNAITKYFGPHWMKKVQQDGLAYTKNVIRKMQGKSVNRRQWLRQKRDLLLATLSYTDKKDFIGPSAGGGLAGAWIGALIDMHNGTPGYTAAKLAAIGVVLGPAIERALTLGGLKQEAHPSQLGKHYNAELAKQRK